VNVCFVGACRVCGRKRAYSLFVAYHKAKTLLGIPRPRWEGNIKSFGEEKNGRLWTGFIWLMNRTSDGLSFIFLGSVNNFSSTLLLLLPIALRPFLFGLGFPYN
jgi:hypothetical protein